MRRIAIVVAVAVAVAVTSLGWVSPAQARRVAVDVAVSTPAHASVRVETRGAVSSLMTETTVGRSERTVTAKKLWVVPAYWDEPPTPAELEALANAVSDTNEFYASESLGRFRFQLTGIQKAMRVSPTFGSDVAGCSNIESLWRLARRSLPSSARARDIVVVWTPRGNCSENAAGLGGHGNAWFQGVDLEDRRRTAVVLIHELGHGAFGFGHDGRIRCTDGGRSVTFAGSCRYVEYGDPYSVMAGAWGGVPAHQLIRAGLRPSEQWLPVRQSGVFTLNTRLSAAGTTVLQVPLPTAPEGSPADLFLEYRTPTGADSEIDSTSQFFGPRGGSGVIVRTSSRVDWIPPDRVIAEGGLSPLTCYCGLLDMHPELENDGSEATFSPALRQGDAWTTPDGSVAISVTAMNSDSATVSVVMAADDTKPDRPVISIGSGSGRDRRTFGMSWMPNGIDWVYDDVAVKEYRLSLDGRLIRTFREQMDGPSTRIQKSTTLHLPPGRHRISVTAVDYGGNMSTGTKTINVR